MEYYFVEPEVAGGIGSHTVMDRGSHPSIVKRLHYVMDGWFGDELLEGFPVFVMTKRLYTVLSRAELTGAHADFAEVTLSEEFHDLFPNRTVPPFAWLKITGRPGVDDFGIAADHRLVVSSRALDLLNLKHAVIAAFPSATSPKADRQ